MARSVTTRHKTIATVAAWIVALLIFFPILYTIITSFKSEQEAIQGFNLIPSGTFESYTEVQAQSGYFKFFFNSVLLSVYAEILVTTNGGPGYASTNLPFLVYQKALLEFKIGQASAGGVIAVILANIVAFFAMRAVGKNLDK